MLGNIHQGTLGTMGISRSFGTQCTAIAIVALIFASFRLHPHTWTSKNLDIIIFEGDRLYNRIIDSFYNDDSSVILAHDDIPSVTEVFGTYYQTELYSTLYGLVESNPAQRNPSTSVQSALNNAFSMSNHMLATFRSTSVAVLRRGRSDPILHLTPIPGMVWVRWTLMGSVSYWNFHLEMLCMVICFKHMKDRLLIYHQ